MDRVTVTVPGKPVGKGRPRFGNGGRVFTPKETTLAEQGIRDAWINAGSVRLPDGPVTITVILNHERPAGHFKRDGTLSAEGNRHAAPWRQKPDVDNALKLVCDALNGRAWKDDVQIVVARVARHWADVAATMIVAEPYTATAPEDPS